jgi:2-methylisocitrate lyase-like PEP mutase family enzyme
MVEKGRTPVLTRDELAGIGYKIAIFPVTALLASVHAMTQAHRRTAQPRCMTSVT